MTYCELLQNKACEMYEKAREQGQGLMYQLYMRMYNYYINKMNNTSIEDLKKNV